MRKLVEAVLEDVSTREVFLFRIECPSCGLEYGNKPLRFSKADAAASNPCKKVIYDALYEQEHRDARNLAVSGAAEHMNYCPICKRLVCNRGFLICEELDMCTQCALELRQTGQPVLPRMIEETTA